MGKPGFNTHDAAARRVVGAVTRRMTTPGALPAPLLVALADQGRPAPERVAIVHQLNSYFLQAASFGQTETLAVSGCTDAVVVAAVTPAAAVAAFCFSP
jgi:hypothetical protein